MALRPLHSSGDGTDPDFSGGIVSEINITPLVDIFLVLLIIFMVSSSVMSQLGVNVNLPGASAASAEAKPEGVIITLLAGGGLRVNDTSVAPEDWKGLESAVRTALTRSRGRFVILEGDRQAFLGNAVAVMDAAKRAGAERFAIATAGSSAAK